MFPVVFSKLSHSKQLKIKKNKFKIDVKNFKIKTPNFIGVKVIENFDLNILKNYMLKLNELHITDKAYFIIGLIYFKPKTPINFYSK